MTFVGALLGNETSPKVLRQAVPGSRGVAGKFACRYGSGSALACDPGAARWQAGCKRLAMHALLGYGAKACVSWRAAAPLGEIAWFMGRVLRNDNARPTRSSAAAFGGAGATPTAKARGTADRVAECCDALSSLRPAAGCACGLCNGGVLGWCFARLVGPFRDPPKIASNPR